MRALHVFGCATLLVGCGRIGFATQGDGASDDVAAIPLCDQFPDALYCNDFATPDLGVASSQMQVQWDAGTWVLTGGGGNQPSIVVDFPSPITSGPLHLGGHMRVDGIVPIQDYVVFVQVSGNGARKISFDMVQTNTAQLVNSAIIDDNALGTTGALPRDRRFCFELVIDLHPTASPGGVQLFIDGAMAISGWQAEGTVPAGGWRSAELATVSGPSNPLPTTVRFDDWIMRRGPIGCP